MNTTLPSAAQITEALAALSPLEQRRLAVLCEMSDGTIRKIASGGTKNPGIETCRLILEHYPHCRTLRES